MHVENIKKENIHTDQKKETTDSADQKKENKPENKDEQKRDETVEL